MLIIRPWCRLRRFKEGCPLRALDAGPMEELDQKYGDSREASGFDFRKTAGPSIVMSGKVNANKD